MCAIGTPIWNRSIPIMQIDLSVCVLYVHLYRMDSPNNADRSIRMCAIGTPVLDRSILIMQIDLSVCVLLVHRYGIDLSQKCI